jgi:hypothetical protein
MSKPSTLPQWAMNVDGTDHDVVDGTSGQNNAIAPTAPKKLSGYGYREAPARNILNWLFRNISQWIWWMNDKWTDQDSMNTGFTSTSISFLNHRHDNYTRSGLTFPKISYVNELTVSRSNLLSTLGITEGQFSTKLNGIHYGGGGTNPDYIITYRSEYTDNTYTRRLITLMLPEVLGQVTAPSGSIISFVDALPLIIRPNGSAIPMFVDIGNVVCACSVEVFGATIFSRINPSTGAFEGQGFPYGENGWRPVILQYTTTQVVV